MIATDLQEKLVSLTRDLILIPSTETLTQERERCFQFVKNHLEILDAITVHEYRDNNIPSLLALPKNMDTPEILLCAHLDVISHPDLSCFATVRGFRQSSYRQR